MEKRTILIICYNTLHNDPRVLRQIDALKEEYKIVAAGYSNPNRNTGFIELEQMKYKVISFYFNYPILIRKCFSLGTLLYLRAERVRKKLKDNLLKMTLKKSMYYENKYWDEVKKRNYDQLKDVKADLIIANDIYTLPLGAKLKNGSSKLVFDAHEYSPGENDTNLYWVEHLKGIILNTCKTYFPKVDKMFCVGHSIAEAYKTNFGITSTVITNASELVDLKPVKNEGSRIRLIHHGASIRERHLERMIEAMGLVDDRFSLDLMLMVADPLYMDELKEMSKAYPNVNFIDPVATDKIPYVLNKYDAGIVFIPPVNFNYEFCLPNKFYESVQGRLALILGPTKDMTDISAKYNNAIISKDFSIKALAEVISKLDSDSVNRMKAGSDSCAKEMNAKINAAIMRREIKQLLN